MKKEVKEFIESLLEANEIVLKGRDAETFVEALLNPPEPSEALKNAFRMHRELIIDGDMCKDYKYIDGRWVLARPENYRYRTFWERLRDAWLVFTGKCDAIKWEGQ